jgi:hypothetical protein
MSRSISVKGSSTRPATDDSSRRVNPDQSATRRSSISPAETTRPTLYERREG